MSKNLSRRSAAVCIAAGASTALVLSAGSAWAATPDVPAQDVQAGTAAAPSDSSARVGTISVTSLGNSGSGTLREAINRANKLHSVTTISFAVNGTVTLQSNLPAIKKGVIITGLSAPTYTGAAPVVEIDFNRTAGLRFNSGSNRSQVLGLSLVNARTNGVTISSKAVSLNKNYIGLTPAGAKLGNVGDGVYLAPGSSKNVIGNNSATSGRVASNVISGNRGVGVRMIRSTGNTLVANIIGTDPTGSTPIGNTHGGIQITTNSSGNRIGGNVTGISATTGQPNNPTGTESSDPADATYVVPPKGNLVSGNGRNGILINSGSKNNVLMGNFVGTNANGTSAIGNALDGVRITGADNNVLRGCTVTDNPFVYYNVLSGNGRNGLHVSSSDNTVVQANFFGIDSNNSVPVPNGRNGMLFDGNSQNPHVGGVIPLGNVSAGNRQNGIAVKDTVRGFLTFNTFGGLLAFRGAAANGQNGLLITSTGGNQTVRTNVWSGNVQNGVALLGGAHGVDVSPNVIGLSTNGSSALPNGQNGILIGGKANHNLVGGYRKGQIAKQGGGRFSVIPQNTIAYNGGHGLVITGSANNNRVIHSYIGISTVPWFPLPVGGNLGGGVLVSGKAHDNTIGALNNKPSNVISNNTGNGVTLTSGTKRNGLIKNKIGVDQFGAPLPNSGLAVWLGNPTNYIIGGSIKDATR